jgi:hypothetical protein
LAQRAAAVPARYQMACGSFWVNLKPETMRPMTTMTTAATATPILMSFRKRVAASVTPASRSSA